MQSVMTNSVRVAVITGAVLLGGCASHVYDTSTAEGEHVVAVSVPRGAPTPAAAATILANQANRDCPAGYRVEDETTSSAAGEMARWRVHCGSDYPGPSEGGS